MFVYYSSAYVLLFWHYLLLSLAEMYWDMIGTSTTVISRVTDDISSQQNGPSPVFVTLIVVSVFVLILTAMLVLCLKSNSRRAVKGAYCVSLCKGYYGYSPLSSNVHNTGSSKFQWDQGMW